MIVIRARTHKSRPSPGKISRARARSVQDVAVLFARRLVCATNLDCVFPNLHDFILGQQTSELYVLENFGCYHNARNCCCGTRIRNIKDHQCARAFDSGAIKRGQFTPGSFNGFFGCFLPICCWIVQIWLRAWGVYCPVRQKCMAKLSRLMRQGLGS